MSLSVYHVNVNTQYEFICQQKDDVQQTYKQM